MRWHFSQLNSLAEDPEYEAPAGKETRRKIWSGYKQVGGKVSKKEKADELTARVKALMERDRRPLGVKGPAGGPGSSVSYGNGVWSNGGGCYRRCNQGLGLAHSHFSWLL